MTGYAMPWATVSDVDATLADYADYLYFEGKNVEFYTSTLAAFTDLNPRFGRHGDQKLPRAMKAKSVFRKLAPSATRKPLPWHLANLFVLQMGLSFGPLF